MSESNQTDLTRRQFVGKSAAIAAATIAPGVMLYGTAEARKLEDLGIPASSDVRWGMLIDTNKCEKGCNDCVSACQSENGWGGENSNEKLSSPEQKAQWIRKVDLKDTTTGHTQSLPVMCQHCENPPCVDVCPTTASMKRADGVVLVDRHLCIGCRFCMMACPYKARSFVHESLTDQKPHAPRGKGCVESCNICVHKLDALEIGVSNATTACSASCTKGAITVGDLNDEKSEIAQQLKKHKTTQIRADLGLNTGVRYRGI